MITGRTDHPFPSPTYPYLTYVYVLLPTYLLGTKSYPLGQLISEWRLALTDWLVRYCFACLAHLAWAWLGGLSQYLGTDDLNPSARSSRVLRAAFRLVSVDSFDLVFWFPPLITDAYQPCVQLSARAAHTRDLHLTSSFIPPPPSPVPSFLRRVGRPAGPVCECPT